MQDPFKPKDWLAKIPSWAKSLWGSITAVAAAIILFRDNWGFYLIAAAIVIPAYLLFAHRNLSRRNNQWVYRFGKYRFLGLAGEASKKLPFNEIAAVS